MAYKVTSDCLQCGYCISRCPQKAFIPSKPIEREGVKLQPVHIDAKICNDCGICVSTEYWCPAEAVVKV
jgi:NAD-dependent dihydropyrimidine dehydrogenase PreA subunit